MGLTVTVVTPPSQTAVSIESAKKHLNVTHADDDSYIEALVEVATLKVESETSRRLMRQTSRYTIDTFPCDSARPLILPVHPIASINSVQYIDPQGATQTWDPAKYVSDLANEPARLAPAFGQIFPITQYRLAAAWVNFDAGYTEPEDVPAPLLQALLLIVGTFYENRETIVVGSVVSEIPNAAEWLLRPYRLFPMAG